MKRFLPILSFAVVMAACNQSPKMSQELASKPAVTAPAMNPDTVGLAKFQQWQATNELGNIEEIREEIPVAAAAAPAKKATVRKKATAPVRSVAKASAPVRSSSNTQTSSAGSSSNDGGAGAGNEGGSLGNETAQTAEAPAKEGWSKAAKGAVIGAAGGAAAGAVINKKNRAVGAVIGAVIGAGGGYVVGRTQDKKDGRY